eukprot:1151820-Pelagomonas_calceolata.AAC.4
MSTILTVSVHAQRDPLVTFFGMRCEVAGLDFHILLKQNLELLQPNAELLQSEAELGARKEQTVRAQASHSMHAFHDYEVTNLIIAQSMHMANLAK